MARLKQQDRKAYGEIQKFFKEQLATSEGLGYPIRGEWEGFRAYMYITTGTGLSGGKCPRSRTTPAPRMTRWSRWRLCGSA